MSTRLQDTYRPARARATGLTRVVMEPADTVLSDAMEGHAYHAATCSALIRSLARGDVLFVSIFCIACGVELDLSSAAAAGDFKPMIDDLSTREPLCEVVDGLGNVMWRREKK